MLKVNLRPAQLAVGTRRVHYAWVMVAVAATMWMTTSGVRFAAAILVPDLQDIFGWSIFAIFAGFAIQWIAAAFFSPIVGWLGDRYGVRRIMAFGAGLFIAGMLLTGTMTHLWQFYLYYGLVLAIAMAIFQVPLVAAVTLWFKKHLCIAMGTLQALQGLGTVVGIVIVAVLLDSLGLKWTFWIPGIAGGAILFTLVRLFYNEPGEIGIKPWGALEDDPLERLLEASIAKARTSVFLKQAQRPALSGTSSASTSGAAPGTTSS